MQPQSMAKLIEVGEYQGDTFVVTVAPPYQRLDEWLAEQDRAAAAAKEFGKAGFWKRPDVGALAPPPPPAKAPVPPAAAAEPGEFTKQFQRPAAPAPEPGLPLQRRCGSAILRRLRLRRRRDEFAKLFSGTSTPASAHVRRRLLPRRGGIGRSRASLRGCSRGPGGAAAGVRRRRRATVTTAAPAAPTPAPIRAAGGAGRVHADVPESGRAARGRARLAAVPASAPRDAGCAAPRGRGSRANSRGCSRVRLRRPRQSRAACRTAAHRSPPAPPAAGGAGEFTRMFQSRCAAAGRAGPRPQSAARRQRAARRRRRSRASSRGCSRVRLRRRRRSQACRRSGECAGDAAAGPGEFTRLFQAPPPPPGAAPHRSRQRQARASSPACSIRRCPMCRRRGLAAGGSQSRRNRASSRGCFRRLRRPAGSGPPPPTGGEFTQFFQAVARRNAGGTAVPLGVPVSAGGADACSASAAARTGRVHSHVRPGSAVRRRAAGPAAPPPAPPASYGPGGGATQAFRSVPGSAPAAAPQGPSEYTRMISVPSNPGAPPPPRRRAAPPAAQMPGMPQMGMPQMPYMQPPACRSAACRTCHSPRCRRWRRLRWRRRRCGAREQVRRISC